MLLSSIAEDATARELSIIVIVAWRREIEPGYDTFFDSTFEHGPLALQFIMPILLDNDYHLVLSTLTVHTAFAFHHVNVVLVHSLFLLFDGLE